MCFPERLEVMDDTLLRVPPVWRNGGTHRGERSAQTPSWISSLNMMHIKSIALGIGSSRETNRDLQVVWKTLISLVAGSRLGFVTLSPSWLAVDRSLSCLHLCDRLLFPKQFLNIYSYLFISSAVGGRLALFRETPVGPREVENT